MVNIFKGIEADLSSSLELVPAPWLRDPIYHDRPRWQCRLSWLWWPWRRPVVTYQACPTVYVVGNQIFGHPATLVQLRRELVRQSAAEQQQRVSRGLPTGLSGNCGYLQIGGKRVPVKEWRCSTTNQEMSK